MNQELQDAWTVASIAFAYSVTPTHVVAAILEKLEWDIFWIDGAIPTCCPIDKPECYIPCPADPRKEPRSKPSPSLNPHTPNLPDGGWRAKRYYSGNSGGA